MRYRIRGMSVAAAAQSGFVFGLILGALPSFLNVLAISFFTHNLYVLLNGLNHDIGLGVNLAEKLGLIGTIQTLDDIDEPLTYLLIFIVGIVFTGLVLCGLTAVSTWIYNRIYSRHGGLDVTLEPLPDATPAQKMGSAPVVSPVNVPPPIQAVSPAVPNTPASQLSPNRAVAGPSPTTATPASSTSVPPPTSAPRPSTVSSQPVAPPLATVSGPRLSLANNPSQIWLITKIPYSIGGAAGVDMYIGGLQPRHAHIEFDSQARAYVIYDLSNGQTRVNQRQVVEKNMLKDGFHVQLGAVELIFNT